MTGLVAEVGARAGALRLAVRFEAALGRTMAILGPNGSGKSTLLRVLAGIHPLDAGRISNGTYLWADEENGVSIPPHRRSVGMVFQNLALFPSMSVLANVAYGAPRESRRGGAERDALDLLASFGLEHLSARRPTELSGGEAQMVALARALLPRPDVLLLDEPLAALDVRNRGAARRILRHALGDFEGVKILVTHDPVEAGALADDVLILEAGRVAQEGSMASIAARPRSPFAAALAGVNMFSGSVARTEDGIVLVTDSGSLVIAEDLEQGAEVIASIHPHAISLSPAPPHTSARNVIASVVEELDEWGSKVRVRLSGAPPLTAEVTPSSAAKLGLETGSEVFASVKATEIEVYPA